MVGAKPCSAGGGFGAFEPRRTRLWDLHNCAAARRVDDHRYAHDEMVCNSVNRFALPGLFAERKSVPTYHWRTHQL